LRSKTQSNPKLHGSKRPLELGKICMQRQPWTPQALQQPTPHTTAQH